MLKEFMVSLGYSIDGFQRLKNTYPVCKCGDDYLCVKIRDVFKLLMNLGYSDKQIIKITTERPNILCYELEIIFSKFEYLKKLFGSRRLAIKVTVDFPTLYSYDIESIDKKINDLVNVGYDKVTIIKNIKKYPELLGLSVEDNIKKMIDEFQRKGFSEKDVIKITGKNMTILGRDIKVIKNTIDKFKILGYSQEDIIAMIKKHPTVFNYADGRVESRISDLVSLGIDYTDVLNIFKQNPSLFGNVKSALVDKKLFYDSIGLFNIFVDEPQNLIQGLSKSYARYMYFLEIGVNIHDGKDGYKELFLCEKRF